MCKEAPIQENKVVKKECFPAAWMRLAYIGFIGENLLKQYIQ